MMTVGSLFSGIGGFELGFEAAGSFKTAWQVENNKQCLKLLEEKWPHVKKFSDIRTLPLTDDRDWTVDLICGGDPCPKHSRARKTQASRHPDLSGYFLAVAARLRPRWVVRENVPAPTVEHFDAALAALGYGTVLVRMDASRLTGQSRTRDFIVGRYQTPRTRLRKMFPDLPDGPGPLCSRISTRQVCACLTTLRQRHNTDDNYVFHPPTTGRTSPTFRLLDSQERETLAGFPRDWTQGFSPTARAKMLANSIVPANAAYIGEKIIQFERAYYGAIEFHRRFFISAQEAREA